MREQDCIKRCCIMQVAIEQLQQELAVSRREEEATRDRARKVLQAMLHVECLATSQPRHTCACSGSAPLCLGSMVQSSAEPHACSGTLCRRSKMTRLRKRATCSSS